MSDVLARLRVRETHGIRRFLYPLTAEVQLPVSLNYAALGIATRDNDVDMDRLCLVTDEGQPVPVQVTHVVGERFRVDFGVSLAPGAVRECLLMPGLPKIVDDPLRVSLKTGEALLRSRQQRFDIALLDNMLIGKVVYDGAPHLRDHLSVTRNGHGVDEEANCFYNTAPAHATLAAWAGISQRYKDGCACRTETTITACKSWATVVHTLKTSQPNDEIVFTLPFAATAPTLTYDVGLDGVYGKLEAKNEDAMTWRMEFDGKPHVRWSVATNDRTDYAGSMTAPWFQGKRWFHLIDGGKSLAVAITQVPKFCKEITVRLGSDGEVRIAFRMRRKVEENAEFGVCYHFLNDVPAIAAATNPQSILLPPMVEVLAA